MKTALLSDSAVQQLLAWFRREGKAYPWGEDITPYRVWISEVMLQQTVVTAAIPFFNRWMARFPDPAALAEAQEEEVLRYWEGLGYYSRGRNLLKAARVIRDERGGRLPEDLAGWRSLPGVGEYTARAVLSIAAGRPYPVLDANVRRIGRRILAAEVWEKGADGELLASLTECIPAEEPGTFNAALMQLGQLVCRTGTPDCPSCPLKEECEAHHRGTAPLIPEKKKRIITSLKSRRFLFFAGDRVFLIRRDAGIGKGSAPVDALGRGAEHFDDETRRGAKIRVTVGRVAGQQQVWVIEHRGAGDLEAYLHVVGEQLATVLPCRGRQGVGQSIDDERMPIARAGHGVDLAVDIIVAQLAILFAGEIVVHRHAVFQGRLSRHGKLPVGCGTAQRIARLRYGLQGYIDACQIWVRSSDKPGKTAVSDRAAGWSRHSGSDPRSKDLHLPLTR